MFLHVVANVPKSLTRVQIIKIVARCAGEFELHKVMLEEKAARLHWHWKRAGISGTLEVTWDARENQLVVSVHQNRVGANEWAKHDAPKFAARLADELKGQVQDAPHRN